MRLNSLSLNTNCFQKRHVLSFLDLRLGPQCIYYVAMVTAGSINLHIHVHLIKIQHCTCVFV